MAPPSASSTSRVKLGSSLGLSAVTAQAPAKNCTKGTAPRLCVCRTCDCGKHRCGRSVAVSDAPLSSDTEHAARFVAHPIYYAGKVRPPPHSVICADPLSSDTESRVQYSPKTLPSQSPLPRREYVPNPARLESVTGYATDYPPWEVSPRSSCKKPDPPRSPAPFDGTTTTKTDYREWTVNPRYVHPKAPYSPSSARLEALTSYTADYPLREVHPPATRPPELYSPTCDDRDFVSTMRRTFGECTRDPSMPPARRRAPAAPPAKSPHTFEGISTSHHDYATPPDTQPVVSCKPPPSLPQKNKFVSSTEYTDIYTPKSVPRSFREPTKYTPNPSSFVGVTTMKVDFKDHGEVPRCPDFRPNNAYVDTKDDRTWSTQTRHEHGPKASPVCAVVKAKTSTKEPVRLVQHNDGHVYLEPVQSGGPAC